MTVRPFTADDVAQVLGLDPGKYRDRVFAGVSTDSRTVGEGDLWFALKGEQFDAHDFAVEAARKGASALVVERGRAVTVEMALRSAGVPALVYPVEDALHALGELARVHRARCRPCVIGLTGSNGKTSTKEMIAGVAALWMEELFGEGSWLSTMGNLNNLIGVPHTIFRLTGREKLVVVEMGMSHFHEIERMTQISDPDVALITNVGPAHLEGVGGTLEGVARAKGELFAGVRPASICVVNMDDPHVRKLPRNALRTVTFGSDPGCDVALCESAAPGSGRQQVTLRIGGETIAPVIWFPGRHNAMNAAAAAAAALAAGAPVEHILKGLEAARPISKRMQLEEFAGAVIINDCYNANPASMKAGIDAMLQLRGAGQAIAVLGDMKELGEQSEELHRAMGRYVASSGVTRLVAFGPHARWLAEEAERSGMSPHVIMLFDDPRKTADYLRGLVEPGDIVLIKGSRGMAMERILEAMRNSGGEG
ncbi:MAG: UDP-N-acetylmuramoyl-tripeptide--D-alanyl-D-alanine ligase [Myxococcota bacterium]|nr:UDP-N-acetylmuramoyl-tripeptide--D-alanyl-D-alanine ligase [Myxococcota bacterium]